MKAINILFSISALLFSAAVSCSSDIKSGSQTRPEIKPEGESGEKKGEVLSPWTKGELDIHFINTGRGESTFLIFPDGTSLLVDMAGSTLRNEDSGGKYPMPAKPNTTTSSAEAIVSYINHFMEENEKGRGHIDYALLSHYHEDHMGTYRPELPTGGDGSFKLTSLCEIGTRLPYRHYLDRCYPKYDYPKAMTADKFKNVKAFVEWSVKNNGTVAEAMDAGSSDQITLQYDKASYPEFKVQNLSANGRFWSGSGESSSQEIPLSFEESSQIPDENTFSCAFKLSYGKFDFYTGGDHQFNGRSTYPYFDSEAPMAKVIGRVDVAKGNHHGTKNTNSAEFMAAIRPSVWINHVWRDVQPNPATLENVLSANPDCLIFLTNLSSENETKNGKKFSAEAKKAMQCTQGHYVVRVSEGGDSYFVYALDDSDMKYVIKDVYGPFNSK